MKRKREGITVCGAYGLGNAGDEAILRAVVSQLRREVPARTVTVITAGRARTGGPGIQIISRRRVIRWLRQLRKTKLFISGGGSLLQDVTSRRSLLFYLFTIHAAHKRGAAVMLYGCGIGPLQRPLSCDLTVRTLNRCADSITLRDSESLVFLRRLGVREELLHLAADPVFAQAHPGRTDGNYLGICCRQWPGFEEKADQIASAVRRICAQHALRPLFFALGDGDEEAAEAIKSRLDGPEYTMAEKPEQAADCALMLSMRLHGLIFAMCAQIPCVGISYDPKVSALCEETDMPWMKLEDVTDGTLCELAGNALSQEPLRLREVVEKLNARAQVSIDEAERLLSADR